MPNTSNTVFMDKITIQDVADAACPPNRRITMFEIVVTEITRDGDDARTIERYRQIVDDLDVAEIAKVVNRLTECAQAVQGRCA